MAFYVVPILEKWTFDLAGAMYFLNGPARFRVLDKTNENDQEQLQDWLIDKTAFCLGVSEKNEPHFRNFAATPGASITFQVWQWLAWRHDLVEDRRLASYINEVALGRVQAGELATLILERMHSARDMEQALRRVTDIFDYVLTECIDPSRSMELLKSELGL